MRKGLEEYTTDEKIAWFDEMYKQAVEDIEEFKRTGIAPKDGEYCAWESMMKLLGKDIFKEWNAIVVVAER